MHEVWDPSQLVATLFFFAHAELCLPPRRVIQIPSPLENDILDQYGEPEFARYELYPRSVGSADNLNLSSIVGWATLPTTQEHCEIGVFTVLNEINAPKVRSRLEALLVSTITDLRPQEAQEGLEQALNTMREQMQ
jgi:hypothetical protein